MVEQRDDIKEKGLSGRKCTTVLHGGECHCTSIPRKSGNKMKRIARWEKTVGKSSVPMGLYSRCGY